MVESPRTTTYLRLIRSSAWYDLVVTIGFATPWTYALLHQAMNAASEAFGLSPLHEANPTQLLYANLMGSVVTIWALLRLVRPQRIHGLFDGMARLLFATWFVYALSHGGPELLWALLVPEVAWGIAQLAPWLSRRFRRSRSDQLDPADRNASPKSPDDLEKLQECGAAMMSIAVILPPMATKAGTRSN